MPKLIDHTERKKLISAAVWKLLEEQGVSAISIRNVAAEAGISTGSLRHSFESRLELLEYALHLINERIEGNVRALSLEGRDVLKTVKILEYLIPLTPDTETIARVILGMVAEMRSTPEIQKIAQLSLQHVHATYFEALTWLNDNGELLPGTDVQVQADQLMMLGHGLSLKVLINGLRSDPVSLSRAFRSQVNRILVNPVPYLTQEELDASPGDAGS